MDKWYVRSTTGKVFGPIGLDMLKTWVKDGRVEPLAGISTDLVNWTLAPLRPELEMNWVVENEPGQFYGPTHRNVIDDLVKAGSLSKDARFYCDDRGAAIERLRSAEAAVAASAAEVVQRDSRLAAAQQLISKKDLQLAAAQKAVAKRDERISEAVASLERKESQLAELNRAVQLKDGEIARLKAELAQRDAERNENLAALERLDAEKKELQAQIARNAAAPKREWKSEVLEPEVVDEVPPPVARQRFSGNSTPPSALAELERRAREELSRIGGASARDFFRRK